MSRGQPGRGLGIDAEQVSRFAKLAAGEKPWRLVYGVREAADLAAQPQAALAFCAAFCCKESFFKALGDHFSFPDLACRYRPGAAAHELELAPGLSQRHGLARVQVTFDERSLETRGELIAITRIWRGPWPPAGPSVSADSVPPAAVGSRLETLEVAAVDAERRRIEQEHFRTEELADLGSRRVQSLAGFLALKRALAALWAELPGVAAPRPGDFVLGHLASGAPRLLRAPVGLAPEEVLVSISHTRRFAYALAEVAPGPALLYSGRPAEGEAR